MASRPISPGEPPKKLPPPIQPNAHPYAIKTTSSALLSRSNSSSHSAHHTRHHYVPSPPSGIPRVRHRHSSSLSSVEGEAHGANGMRTNPMPLPAPPPTVAAPSNDSSASLEPVDEQKLSHRVRPRRAGTMPTSSATQPIIEDRQKHEFSHDQSPKLELYSRLHSNPKQWNTDQLTTYLETSFKSGNTTNGDEYGSSLAGILKCVRARGLTGRELLRLTDADLAGTPLSDAQCAQLLECSRALRADVLCEHVYVGSYRSHEISDNLNNAYIPPTRSSTPFRGARGASVSTDDLRLIFDNNTGEGNSPIIPSAVTSLHRSNSILDASTQRYRDLARMRMRRRGKVKGLVETWERASTSGSECSASETESESETDPESTSISDTNVTSPNLSFSLHEPPPNVCSPVADSSALPDEPRSLGSPPPYTYMHNEVGSIGVDDEEPSIGELLAASSDSPLTGARAWEADFGLGDTVKRIPVSLSVDAGAPLSAVTDLDISLPKDNRQSTKSDSFSSKRSGMRRSTGRRRGDADVRNRVVTAIFTGSSTPSDNASENATNHHHNTSGANGVARSDVTANSDLQNDPDLQALEKSIAATRAQLESFRLRLEKVEADTARQEAMQIQAQFPDSRPSSDVEIRWRRTEANERTALKIAESSKDKIGARIVLDSWKAMSLADMTRAIVAKTVGWLFPYGHLGVRVPQEQASVGPPLANDKCRSPVKRNGRLPVARMSCSIILVSFAICAAILRRMGFGRWVRRP